MDVFFSCPLSPDDLSGVLKTIILFLESLKLGKSCEILKSECQSLGFDISFETKVKNEASSASEKEISGSIFGTSEEVVSNAVIVGYSKEPDFKSTLKSIGLPTPDIKKQCMKTSEPFYKNIGIQYDETYSNLKTPQAQYNEVELCNVPAQNGSGENKTLLKMWPNDEMLEKFKTLQIEHIKLMGITAELVKVLQLGISGQSESFFHLREKCRLIYPDLFVLMQNNDELMDGKNKNTFQNDAEVLYLSTETRVPRNKLEMKRSVSDTCLAKQKNISENKLEKKESSKSLENIVCDKKSADIIKENHGEIVNKKTKSKNEFLKIDYGKLKSDLINADDGKKMLILQALRWRITKQPAEIRKNVMASYIQHDLLCLQAPFREKLVFLESLYCPKNSGVPNLVQDSIARLVNTFASLSTGRDYLCQYDNLLTQLLLPLILNKHHSLTKLSSTTMDMLVATLQKLSLRFHARQKMITFGLTEFLINFLNENHANISVYCLEFCTALMMNLCLHKEGRSRCTLRARDAIKLIKNLLNSKHAENIMPYVSGTMYSLLGNRKINAEAKLMDLASLLRHHIKQSDGDNKKQLEYILKIHLEGSSIKYPDPKIEADEIDLLEPELEENDTVKGVICGEQILAEYQLQENYFDVNNVPFRNVPITPRPKSTKTEISDKLPLNCPHPSKCTSVLTEEVVKQEKMDSSGNANNIIPPGSPAESFSEVTKQFYHKPSKKKGIFDRKKLKFPKNPYQIKLANIPSDIHNPEVNSSEQNFLCNCGYKACEYNHLNSNKYSCCCYEAMKTFIENTNTVNGRSDSCCQTNSNADAKNNDFGEMKNERKANTCENLCNTNLELKTEGSCNKTCVLEGGENCCKCYNVIFQSRPRIIRTPPQ